MEGVCGSTVASGASTRLGSAFQTGVKGSSTRRSERQVSKSHRREHPWVPPKTSRPHIAIRGSPRRREQRRSPVPRPWASRKRGHRHPPKGMTRYPPVPPSPQQQILGGSYPLKVKQPRWLPRWELPGRLQTPQPGRGGAWGGPEAPRCTPPMPLVFQRPRSRRLLGDGSTNPIPTAGTGN